MTTSVIEALKRVSELSAELKKFSGGVLSACDAAAPDDPDGISLLQAKSATLMRYNYNLIRFCQARIKGQTIEPIAEKLVQDWVVLEKMRPIERKLRHQIDQLLKTASRKAENEVDEAERHRPDPSALVIDSDAEDSEAGEQDSVYRPPKLAEVVYDGGDRKAAREMKERERAKARAVRSEGVREMLAEVKGLPEEIRDDEMGGGEKSAAVRRLMKEDEKRREFEEENFTRLNVTRKDKKRRRELERAAEGPSMDGANEFDGLMAMADRVITSKGRSTEVKGGRRGSEIEEQYKLQKLDEITEAMEGGNQRTSSRSSRKRRKRK